MIAQFVCCPETIILVDTVYIRYEYKVLAVWQHFGRTALKKDALHALLSEALDTYQKTFLEVPTNRPRNSLPDWVMRIELVRLA